MDILSYVMGVQAGKKSGGSSGGDVQRRSTTVTLTGAAGERVTHDFGFLPDFLMVYPHMYNESLSKGDDFMWWGYSQEFRDKAGFGLHKVFYLHANATFKFLYDDYNSAIDRENTNIYSNGIYGADETGFNIGSAAGAHCSGKYVVEAFKFI